MDKIVLPPALFYGVGAALIVFGVLRAVFLGWKQRPRVVEGDEEEGDAGGAWNSAGYKRHVTFGVVWMVMGLFLVVSTIIKSR